MAPATLFRYIAFFDVSLGRYLEAVKGQSENERPKVYLEVDFGGGKKYTTAGTGHAHNALIVAAGANNIFSNVTGSKEVDPESVVLGNPEIILMYKYLKNAPGIDMDLSNTSALEAVRDDMLSRPELKNVQAVKDKKVYVLE